MRLKEYRVTLQIDCECCQIEGYAIPWDLITFTVRASSEIWAQKEVEYLDFKYCDGLCVKVKDIQEVTHEAP